MNSAITTYPEAKVKKLKFPEISRQYFIDNWLNVELRTHKTPYQPLQAIEMESWKVLLEALFVAELNGTRIEKLEARNLLELIPKLRSGKGKEPCFLIENFPIDPESNIIAVPHDPKRLNGEHDLIARGKTSTVTEAAMSGFLALIGQFPQMLGVFHQGAAWQHNVVRTGFNEEPNTSLGGGLHSAHTEAASFASASRVEYLSLSCMRNRHTQTSVLPIEDIVRLININFTEDEMELLKKPLFQFRPSSIYVGSTPAGFLDDSTSPILFLKKKKFTEGSDAKRIRFDYETIVHPDCPEGIKEAANNALEKLSRVVNDNMCGVTLKPGNFFGGNNDLFVHGKAPQHPEDGDRWLIRGRTRFDEACCEKMMNDIQLFVNCTFMTDARIAHFFEKEDELHTLEPDLKKYLNYVTPEVIGRHHLEIKLANYLVKFGEIGVMKYQGEPNDFQAYHMGIKGAVGPNMEKVYSLHDSFRRA